MKIVETLIIVLLLLLLALTIYAHYLQGEKANKAAGYLRRRSPETARAPLRISRGEIYQNPAKVNKLLAEHNITNLRVITKEQFQEQFEKSSYLLSKAKDLRQAAQVNFPEK